MTKSKVVERIIPAQEKSKGIAINEDSATSKGKATKLPTTSGKGKGKGRRPTFARKTITLDPNTPSWSQGFCKAVHVFLVDSDSIDLGESGTTVPPEVTPDTDARLRVRHRAIIPRQTE
uniref:Integrase core domain containing protein n=1 Tax=Solanum tuberosum TaxID=4113 RepID=M1DRL6_SOLTU